MGRQMISRWFLGLGLSFSTLAAAWSVDEIHFVVDGQEDIPSLHGIAEIKRGDEFSYKKIDEALARLGQSGRFRYAEARVDTSARHIFFVLRSIYKVRNVRFALDLTSAATREEREAIEADLRDEISIKAGDPVDLGLLSVVNSQVVRRLESRGYVGAEAVTLFEEVAGTQQRDLIVNVKLPTALTYSQIAFVGFSPREEQQVLSAYGVLLEFPGFSKLVRTQALKTKQVRMDLVALNSVMEEYQKGLREHGFYDARIDYEADVENGGLKIVQSRGTKYRVDFKGSVYFWERYLRDRALERIENFSVPFDANDVASQVSDIYKQVGFKDIKIQWSTKLEKNKDIEVSHYEFRVDEGKQFFLGDVLFLGGIGREESLDVELARREWILANSDPLHFIYFDEASLRARANSLLRAIREKGYIEAKFVDLRFEPIEGSRKLNMVANLQIGQKYYVESVSFAGLSFLPEDVKNSIVSIAPGDPVIPSKILEINAKIESYLRNHGFIEARMESSEALLFRKRPTFNRVDVVFQGQSGPKVLVGKTVIEGNETTKIKVVERELYERTLVPGQAWNSDGERRLRENLLALGIFGSAQTEKIAGRVVGTDPTHGFEIQQKDLKIALRERPAGSIEMGPGYRTDLGIIGFAEFNYRNLFQENYGFLTRAQVSRKLNNYQFLEQRYSATLLDPYFASQRIRLRTLLLYQKKDDTVFLDGKARGLSIEELNLALTAEFLLADKWSWIQNVYTISRPRLFNIIDSDSATREGSQRYRIGTIGSTLIYDGRDNIFNPNRGWYSVSGAEFASPLFGSDPDVNFLTFRQELTRYFRTGPGSVIALSAEYARLWGLKDSARGVPANKRLYLGGQNSLRFLPEKTLRYDEAGVQGQQSFEFKAEYRQPWIYDLSIAFFADIGRVDVLAPTTLSNLSSGWREGLGVGVRYATPVGPLALDFAFNLDPAPEESNYQIQFSIGAF